MQKVFAKKLKENTFSFYDDDVYHLLKVLRLGLGDKIIVNHDGLQYLTEIIKLEPLLTKIIQPLDNNTSLKTEISLFQAVIKPKNFEWIIAKSAEMQISEFHPVMFLRSNPQNSINEKRVEMIAKTASSQCGANFILKTFPTVDFHKSLELLNSYDLIIVPYENDGSEHPFGSIKDLIIKAKKIAIIIGPEGGFATDEIKSLLSFRQTKLITLTKTILKSDTAAFYCIANTVNTILEGENHG